MYSKNKKVWRNQKIFNTILDHVGCTPMVRLNNITENLSCEILVKCEFLNPGGSIKDRIAKRMVLDKIEKNELHPNDTIIEPSSGNTGIGLAITGAALNMNVKITLSSKNSPDKFATLKSLGAETITTPEEADYNSPEGYLAVAKKLSEEIPNSFMPNQYENPLNPQEHYESTAEEIIEQCDGKIDLLVICAGTGGTITGISTKIREKIKNCKIIGVDPEGSFLADESHSIGPYKVEGIGYDFLPKVFDPNSADKWVKVDDHDSFITARRLIKEEGILCGGSSGSAMAAALREAKHLKSGQRCVVILPDSIRNYLSKFLSDKWMMMNGFMEIPLNQLDLKKSSFLIKTIREIPIKSNLFVTSETDYKDVYKAMIENGLFIAGVTDKSGPEKLDEISVVTRRSIYQYLTKTNNEIKIDNPTLSDFMEKNCDKISQDNDIPSLIQIFKKSKYAIVYATKRNIVDKNIVENDVSIGILERKDLYCSLH